MLWALELVLLWVSPCATILPFLGTLWWVYYVHLQECPYFLSNVYAFFPHPHSLPLLNTLQRPAVPGTFGHLRGSGPANVYVSSRVPEPHPGEPAQQHPPFALQVSNLLMTWRYRVSKVTFRNAVSNQVKFIIISYSIESIDEAHYKGYLILWVW